MSEFRTYTRLPNPSQMRAYEPGEDLSGINVSPQHTPTLGGMIARDPTNHDDQWYVPAAYFRDNFDPQPKPITTEGGEASLLTMGQALTAVITQGRKATRRGWNGPNQFIYADSFEGHSPFMSMQTTAGHIQVGWLASQGDLFAEDWLLLPEIPQTERI